MSVPDRLLPARRPGDLKAVDVGPTGGRYIRKLEATGEVLITHHNQTVSSESGIVDMRANLGTMIGNVVVTRGQDTMRGPRLVVDAATGVSRFGPR
jgi:lipopolysaccharide export system protein LptA